MKTRHFSLLLAMLLMLPLTSLADSGMKHMEMDKGDMHGKMEKKHGESMAMDHDPMMGEMIMLGEHEVDGVKAMAHLKDVRQEMAEHGMKMTHHIMVMFADLESGDPIAEGKAAVKVEDPREQVGKPLKMMGMQGHFGVDLTLDQKGMYHFKIGTKLPDGKKRTFHFHHEID